MARCGSLFSLCYGVAERAATTVPVLCCASSLLQLPTPAHIWPANGYFTQELKRLPSQQWQRAGRLGCQSRVGIAWVQVPLALVEGRVPFILWPPSRAGWVRSHLPPGRLLVKNDDALRDPSRFGAM